MDNITAKGIIVTTKLLLSVFFLTLCGCAGLKTRHEVSKAQAKSKAIKSYRAPATSEKTSPKASEALKGLSESEYMSDSAASSSDESMAAKSADSKITNAVNSEKQKIPVVRNALVEKWIQYFTVKDRERFQRFLNRGQKYRDVVETVLEENDLPAELFYLAMIESGYSVEAHSHANAKGVWQFIPGTATRYGLRVDRYADERQDPIRSTEAAAKYLRDLYNVFGSWPLAMGAYNAGEMRILRAVFRGKTRDFWKLVDAKVLPKETENYFPKFLAVVLIGMDPSAYGFTNPTEVSSFPSVESIEVPGSLSLSEIARVSKIPISELKAVNPHIKATTPPGGNYELWIPTQFVASINRSQKELARLSMANKRQVAQSKRQSGKSHHIVRRGENLSIIAKKYKMSVGHLKRMNSLKTNKLYVGTKLLVKPKSYSPSKTVRYTVKRGDNLTFIAKKFNTTVSRLRKINNLHRNKIMVGQVLKLDASL